MVGSIRKLRRWKEADAGWFREMDNRCFPVDTSFSNDETYHWWVIRDEKGTPMAYAALRIDNSGWAHFTRCGVLPEFRGQGLQDRLIKARVAWCRKNPRVRIIKTYTSLDNVASMNNLLDAGFTRRKSGQWYHYRLVIR